MTVKGLAKTIGKKLSGIFFPEGVICLSCGGEIPGGFICEKCREKISFIQKACGKCGCEVFGGDYCVRCKSAQFPFEKCLAVCGYDDFAKNLVYRFKNGERYLVRLFSSLMADRIKESGIVFDAAVCVPVTQKVLRKRGYNQSALLAAEISEKLGIPFISDFLAKVKDTDFQKNLKAAKRRENVKGAYKAGDKSTFKDKTLLLVDDVITTGSTLSECSRVLTGAGAKKVFCAVFAAVSLPVSFDKP